MARVHSDRHPLLEWAVAAAPKRGETETGDRYLVLNEPTGVLVGVIDGVGHGHAASVVSQRAVEILNRHHLSESIPQLVRRCHDALRETRGAVMSLARFTRTGGVLTWLGVGNVDGRVIRRNGRQERVALLVRSGIVGVKLPVLRTTSASIHPGDLLVITTDGIDPAHANQLDVRVDPSPLAGQILGTFGTGTDDALVLVARYRTWEPQSR